MPAIPKTTLFCCLLSAFFLFLYYPVSASESSSISDSRTSDTVATESELIDWLSEHLVSGGEVMLSNNITITRPVYLSNYGPPVVIRTGIHGLVFGGGGLSMSSYQITGEGTVVPVVEIKDYGNPGWRNSIHSLIVTATGDGGTAVRISQDDSQDFDYSIMADTSGSICSLGENAVAVEFAQRMDGYFLNASAPRGYAVKAPAGTSLFYSRLEGGLGITSGDGITLDTCTLSGPAADGVITRQNLSANPLHLPVRQGRPEDILGSASSLILMDYSDVPVILHADGYQDMLLNLPVSWNFNELDQIDTTQPGTHMIGGEFPAAYRALGLDGGRSPGIQIDVKDPELPCIDRVRVMREKDGILICLWNWRGQTWTPEDLILWRSGDGTHWQDITGESYISMTDMPGAGQVYTEIRLTELPGTMWFQFEAKGVGEGNVGYADTVSDTLTGGAGGDRTGTDRNGADQPLESSQPNSVVQDRSGALNSGDTSGSVPTVSSSDDTAASTDGAGAVSDGMAVPHSTSVAGPVLPGQTLKPAKEHSRSNSLPAKASAPSVTFVPGLWILLIIGAGALIRLWYVLRRRQIGR